MANTPIQNQAAITAAIQAAATADLILLTTFSATNGVNFTTIENNLATLASNMSSIARQQAVQAISSQLSQALINFQTIMSQTTTAETAVAIA